MQRPDSAGPADRNMTSRRRRIVQVIDDSVRRNGYPPSMREIAAATGLASTSSVSYQLSVLEEQGLVSRERRRPRTTKVRPRHEQPPRDPHDPEPDRDREAAVEPLAQVPLVGRIAAGNPIMAAELPEDVISLPRQLVGNGDLIMLSVAGDSMIGAAIADGDWVVVRRESDVENGDIVAAMLDSDTADGGEATVKTFRKRDGHVWLIPQNPAFTPISGDNATIIGKIVAVLRRV
ncbi:MAG: transcriptional repressor LexA [Trebonia sp.]